MVTVGLPARAASRAASLTRLARSAPTKPEVIRATSFRSTASSSWTLLPWTSRIASRPRTSGRSTSTWRSKRPGTQQGRIERFGAVGGGHHDHAAVGGEAVHLDQQGVEGLLALVVAADDAGAAGLAQGVQLVDEDDAGGLGLGLLEHVADPRRPHAHEHLHEVGAREAEEGHARLAGNRLGQQRLAGAGRTDQQHALGDPPAQDLVFLRRLEEIDDLAEFVDGFVDAGHVVEGDAHVLLGVELAAAAAEGHGRARPAQPPQHEKRSSQHEQRHHDHAWAA